MTPPRRPVYYLFMKRDAKADIINAGADLIHRQGFNRTGLKEILDAAGVPKGSFYFYFKSKEDFGLTLIDHFQEVMAENARPLLADRALPPLQRLARFFATRREFFEQGGCQRGCAIGNLAQEMSDLSPAMRHGVSRVLSSLADSLEALLAEAAGCGDLPVDLDPGRTAAFIVDAWEGALLRMKAEKNVEPLRRFEDMIFSRLLR